MSASRNNYRGLAVILLITAIRTASAQVQDITFSYHQGGIPDFDQRREAKNGHPGLPGNGGQYCAPTSAINCIAFLANHGYGTTAPFGPTDWTVASTYDYATDTIATMGGGMSTDPNKGTTGDDHVTGVRRWLTRDYGFFTLSDFVVSAQFASGSSCPGPNELAGGGAQGAMVMPIVGWYQQNLDGSFTRKGGHVLTMNQFVWRGNGSTATFQISWRDPGSDEGDNAAQSTFRTESYMLTAFQGTFDGSMRTQYQVVGFNSGSNFGFIDGYVSIFPKFGLTWAPGDFEFDLVDFSHIDGSYHTPSFVPADGGIQRAALASTTRVAYLTMPDVNQQSSLRRLDLQNASSNPIQDGLHGTIALSVSRHRRAYVLEDGGISLGAYDLDYIEGNLQATLPQFMNALACDDFADVVYVLGTANRRLIALPPDLSTQMEIQLPPNLAVNVDAQIVASPVSGHLWIVNKAASSMYELSINPNHTATQLSTVNDAALANASSVSMDAFDHVFVGTSGGSGLEFAPNGIGQWVRVSPSILDGLPLGAMFQMSADRSNFDPNTMVGPAYENVLPTEFAVGVADGAPSTFDADANEWTVVGFDFGFPPTPYAESDAVWNPTGGNPNGALESGDIYNETFFSAPVSYLGDRSAEYGASLTFNILIQASDASPHPAVILASPTKRLYYVADPTELGLWTARVVPLSEAGWRVDDWQGSDAASTDMLDVLGNLQAVYINATWSSGDDDTLLDNVFLGGQAAPPCPGDVNGDRVVNLSDLAILLSHYGQTGAARSDGDLDGDGDVDLSDLASLLGYYGSACP